MKKILILFIVLLIGCTKYEESTVTVGFNVTLVGNPITKVSDSEIYSALQQCMPTYYPLQLVGNNKTYYCNNTESITLPIGTYKVSLKGSPKFWSTSNNDWYYSELIGNSCNPNGNYFTYSNLKSPVLSNGPIININCDVIINESGTINIKANYGSAALVFDNSFVLNTTYDGYDVKCFYKINNLNIVFCGTYPGKKFGIYPVDNCDLITTYFDTSKLKYGYWYYLECNNIDKESVKSSVIIDNWNKGEL